MTPDTVLIITRIAFLDAPLAVGLWLVGRALVRVATRPQN